MIKTPSCRELGDMTPRLNKFIPPLPFPEIVAPTQARPESPQGGDSKIVRSGRAAQKRKAASPSRKKRGSRTVVGIET